MRERLRCTTKGCDESCDIESWCDKYVHEFFGEVRGVV
jgi:hypothetical protein